MKNNLEVCERYVIKVSLYMKENSSCPGINLKDGSKMLEKREDIGMGRCLLKFWNIVRGFGMGIQSMNCVCMNILCDSSISRNVVGKM